MTTGCIDTDATVFVEPTVESAQLDATQSSLAVGLKGSFLVRLRLGSRAADTSEVSLKGFSVIAGDQTIVDSLKVVAAPSFPVAVGVDTEVLVDVTFSETDNTIETSAYSILCSGGGAQIVGVFDGSLRGGAIDATSDVIQVTCN